ncbi:hypothetical protein BDW62DRAFT_185619 [Aspergillus aurantiobrunneus]
MKEPTIQGPTSSLSPEEAVVVLTRCLFRFEQVCANAETRRPPHNSALTRIQLERTNPSVSSLVQRIPLLAYTVPSPVYFCDHPTTPQSAQNPVSFINDPVSGLFMIRDLQLRRATSSVVGKITGYSGLDRDPGCILFPPSSQQGLAEGSFAVKERPCIVFHKLTPECAPLASDITKFGLQCCVYKYNEKALKAWVLLSSSEHQS